MPATPGGALPAPGTSMADVAAGCQRATETNEARLQSAEHDLLTSGRHQNMTF
jgi:hypothetical protein